LWFACQSTKIWGSGICHCTPAPNKFAFLQFRPEEKSQTAALRSAPVSLEENKAQLENQPELEKGSNLCEPPPPMARSQAKSPG